MSRANAERKSELRALKRLRSVISRDREATDDTTTGESLRRLAKQGDMQAALLLEEINRPQNRIDELLLAEAIKFDPHWQKLPDGRYRRRSGGAYKTPEELVAALRTCVADGWGCLANQRMASRSGSRRWGVPGGPQFRDIFGHGFPNITRRQRTASGYLCRWGGSA